VSVRVRLGTLFGRWLPALVAAVYLLGPPPVQGAERLVLLELFTNDACQFCASLTPPLERLLADYGGRVAPVFYHVNWPDPGDPFYSAAAVSVESRLRFYAVDAIPHLFIDGQAVPSRLRFESDNLDSVRALIDQRLSQPSPLTIDFSTATRPGSAGIDTTTVTATFTVDGSLPSTDLAWTTAVVEFFVDYSAQPGITPAVRYGHVLRQTGPERGLEPLTFNGSQASGSVEFIRRPAWQEGRIGLVVFVQDTLTHEVLQAATDLPRFDFRMPQQIRQISSGSSLDFGFDLVNRGGEAATYEIFPTVPGAEQLAVSLDLSGATPRGDTLVVGLGPGETRSGTVTAAVTGDPAEASFFLNARDASRPAVVWSRPLKALAGFRYLYVADTHSEAADTLYTNAFDAVRPTIGNGTELRVGVWQTALGQLTDADLEGVQHLFWATGSSFPGITAADRGVLGRFLERGGSLFLSGQDIGWEMADSTSPFFTEDSKAFYNQVLYARYVADNANDFELRGAAGDPIGNNLVLRINGGDGANNQTSPDVIAPLDAAATIFKYDSLQVGALRVDTGVYRLVYFAFGFEGIDTRETREAVMQRVVQWLRSPATTVAALTSGPPTRFEVLANAPNPFNPQTRIFFQLPAAGKVRVRVYDLLGRRVATVADDVFEAGRHAVLFRADGLPSGVYLYEVAFQGQVRRRKMMLLR